MPPISSATLARARQLARAKRRAVFIKGDEVSETRPKGNGVLAIWPNGALTLGVPSGQIDREVRRHLE